MIDETQVETRRDVMDPARASALRAMLGMQAPVAAGTRLPPFFHQIYFWSAHPPGSLGRDGHPKVGHGLVPDMGLPRRMWAGGRLEFHTPLVAGVGAERRSVLETVTAKTGRTGPLGFVTLRHEIWQSNAHCLTEWQDLVYRKDPMAGDIRPRAPVARTDATDQREIAFTSTLLFRYSALTFNGHRIHYDLDYARDVEGYDGLVVHGPLLAQHLMLFATDLLGPLAEFSFRATSPLLQFETATLCRNGPDFWVRGPDGRQCMQAVVRPISK